MDEPEIPRRVTVNELRAALADVDGDLPVVVVAYEGGYNNLSRALVARLAFGEGKAREYRAQHSRITRDDDTTSAGLALYLGGDEWGPSDEDVTMELISTDEHGGPDA